jgi:SAM-dependent methyltransferase
MDPRLSSPAARRNRDPILAVLRRVLPAEGAVLEVASGSGEHAVWLAAHLPGLVFQPSDPEPASRASISAWIAREGLPNVRAPLALDATDEDWALPAEIAARLVAVLCINMGHVAPWQATLGLLRGAGRVLRSGGVLYLYGPYKREGRHTAPSNAAFDASLRARDPASGVRDLEDVVAAAGRAGLALASVEEMPANNLSIIFRKT